MGQAVINGVWTPIDEARLPITDPGVTQGWSVFETLLVREGTAEALDAHLRRLRGSAEACHVPWADEVESEAEALAATAAGPGRLRIMLTRGGNRVLTLTPLDNSRLHQPVRAVRGAHCDEPFLGGRPKHGSRAPWAIAVARSGVDDVLLVDDDGRFTEATTAAIVAILDGALWSAPDDGRILPSTALAAVVERARQRGVHVVREGPPAAGGWDGLYVASSTRDLAPVVELDGQPLPGWDPVGRLLARP